MRKEKDNNIIIIIRFENNTNKDLVFLLSPFGADLGPSLFLALYLL